MYELRYTRYEVQSLAPAAQCCKAAHELPLSLRLYTLLLLRILNLVTRTSNYHLRAKLPPHVTTFFRLGAQLRVIGAVRYGKKRDAHRLTTA